MTTRASLAFAAGTGGELGRRPAYRARHWQVLVAVAVALGSTLATSGCLSWEDEDNICIPTVSISRMKVDGGVYLHIIGTTCEVKLDDFQYALKDRNHTLYEQGEIALQNLSGKWQGIDITWGDDNGWDINPGNNESDRNISAGGSYSDPRQAQIRIDDVKARHQSGKPFQRNEGNISFSFIDSDFNGILSPGDRFRSPSDEIENYYFELIFKPTGDIVAELQID